MTKIKERERWRGREKKVETFEEDSNNKTAESQQNMRHQQHQQYHIVQCCTTECAQRYEGRERERTIKTSSAHTWTKMKKKKTQPIYRKRRREGERKKHKEAYTHIYRDIKLP